MVAAGFAGGASDWNAVEGTPRKAACSVEPQDIHLKALGDAESQGSGAARSRGMTWRDMARAKATCEKRGDGGRAGRGGLDTVW